MVTNLLLTLSLFGLLGCKSDELGESVGAFSENLIRRMLHQNESEVGDYASDSVGSISQNMLRKIEPRLKEVVDTTTTGTTPQADINIGDETTIDYDDTDIESYDYYYGLDYGDEEVGLADLIADLGPDLLQTVSPTLIVGFFESASPEDIESILDNSDLLLKLPAETIGLVMQKLPTELIIKIVNSEGVRDFFLVPPEDPLEAKKQKAFKADISLVLFEKLDVSVIASLPQFLIKSQLENENLLMELLKFPEKLLSLVETFPNLLLEIPTEVLLSIGEVNSIELTKIPIERIFETLRQIPIEVLSSLIDKVLPQVTSGFIFFTLENVSSENIRLVIDILPNNLIIKVFKSDRIKNLLSNLGVDDMKRLEAIQADVVIILFEKLGSDVIASLPKELLQSQLKNIELLAQLPRFPTKLLTIVKNFPELLNEVPVSVFTNILQNADETFDSIPPYLISDLFLEIPDYVLQNLTSTIGRVVQTLPSSAIIQVVDSEVFRNFILNPTRSREQELRIEFFIADTASVLFDKLDVATISSLPFFLIQSQLKNEKLLVELLKFPDKLFSLVEVFPQLLTEIPSHVVLNILQNHSKSITDIPTHIFIKYLKIVPLQVLSNLIRKFSQIPSKAFLSTVQNLKPKTISEVIREIPQAVITTLIQSIPSDSLLLLSSNRALINKLKPKDIENLADKVPNDQLKLLIAHGLLADKKLLEIVPLAAITKVARNFELLSLISDKTLLLVADIFPNLLESLPLSSVAHIVKSRPWIVGMLPMSIFTSISSSRIEGLLALLSDKDIVNLVTFQPALINVAAKLPTNLMIKLVQSRKSLLSKLPSMAQPFISQLLVNEDFIKKFPVSFLASLVGIKGIAKFVTKFAVIAILRVHPSLPTLISPSEFKPFIHFLSDPWFRATIPCRTISMISKDKEATDVVDIIPSSIMEKVITSRRILSCIPTADLKNLMDQRLGLSRLSMSSLIKGARQLPSEKYSVGLLFKFLKQQAPELGKALLKWELRWETK